MNFRRKQTAPKSKQPVKQCDESLFNTSEIAEFTDHMKNEHSKDIYECDMCQFYTDTLWDLQGHMERHAEK